MKIIQQRERIENVHYSLHFGRKDCPGGGWGPSCDKDGNVDEAKMNPLVLKEWKKVQSRMDLILSGKDEEYHPPEVMKFVSVYTQPRIGICDDCGDQVYLEHFTNTCDCGADYNMSGHQLAPREQWGEETGESLSDILMIK
jgi:hypothetical protein